MYRRSNALYKRDVLSCKGQKRNPNGKTSRDDDGDDESPPSKRAKHPVKIFGDRDGIKSTPEGILNVKNAIKSFQDNTKKVKAARKFEEKMNSKGFQPGPNGEKPLLKIGWKGDKYKNVPKFTEDAKKPRWIDENRKDRSKTGQIKKIEDKMNLAIPHTKDDDVFFVEATQKNHVEIMDDHEKQHNGKFSPNKPYSAVHLVGASKKRIYNTVSMDPEEGLKIFEDAKRQGEKLFKSPEARGRLADRIMDTDLKKINEAKARGKIDDETAEKLIGRTKAKLDNFRENGSEETMGFKVHPDTSASVGHWHCHIYCTLGEVPGIPNSATNNDLQKKSMNGADVIKVFQEEVNRGEAAANKENLLEAGLSKAA